MDDDFDFMVFEDEPQLNFDSLSDDVELEDTGELTVSGVAVSEDLGNLAIIDVSVIGDNVGGTYSVGADNYHSWVDGNFFAIA